jgi:mRNA interferase MazF
MKVRRGDVIYLNKTFPVEDHIQGGVRPYVVVSNDRGNAFSGCCTVVPLTGKIGKKPLPTHTTVSYHNSLCLCEQIFTISQKEIQAIRYNLPWYDMKNIDRCLRIALDCGR